MSLRRSLATGCCVTLCMSGLLARNVSVRQGNIIFTDRAGQKHPITSTGQDYQPSLSVDGRSVVFVRHTKVVPYPGQSKEMHVLESELWLADAAGRANPKAIFRGFITPPGGQPLTSFFNPLISPDGRYVYFLAEFAATSHALCRLELSSGHASFLTGGAIEFRLLTSGAHAGWIIGSIRTLPKAVGQGYSYPYYLLAEDGRKISRIADASANLDALVSQYGR